MIRVGLIGLGHNGVAHMEAHRRVGTSEVVALCDVTPVRLNEAAEAMGVGKALPVPVFRRTGWVKGTED